MLINNYKIKSNILFILKNSINMLIPPKKAPNINFVSFIFLFKTMDTVSNNIKSKKKFKIIIRSRYIFILSPIKL